MNNTNAYRVLPGPGVRSRITTGDVMYDVILALLPAAVCGVWRFGARAILLIVTAVLAAVLLEYALNCFFGRDSSVRDGSAAVTGLLLALSLPPDVPVYYAFIGAAAAVFLKAVLGGLGHNRLNPALSGRCLLMIAFTSAMTAFYRQGGEFAGLNSAADAVRLLLGSGSAIIGGSTVALLLGGAFLYRQGHITWHIPVCMLLGYYFVELLSGGTVFATGETIFLLSGGGMLAAVFLANDPVTGPVLPFGRCLFGLCIGLLTALFRKWMAPAESVCLAVLLADLAAPVFDRFAIARNRT